MTRTSCTSTMTRALAVSLVAIALGSQASRAQQANASAAALGMNNNYVAAGQGLDAVAWNPAMLGISRNPAFSINLLTPSGVAGLDPVSWNDFMQFAKKDDSIPTATRHAWLNSVTATGGENGHQAGAMNWLGLSLGPVALQVSTSEAMATKLNPDVFEALMFGNVGATGSPQDLNFAGSNLRLGAFTTGALSYALSFGGSGVGPSGAQSSIGVTAKYVLGNFLMIGADHGSTITADSVTINFPIVMTNTDSLSNNLTKNGSGFGVDVGYAWRSDKLTVSAVAQNVVNSFKWDVSQLRSRPGTATFNGTTNSTSFDEASYASAPLALQQLVSEYTFKPSALVGIGYQLNRLTLVTLDAHQQMGDDNSILIGPKTQVGGGLEFRGIPLLPLRAGASYVTGGWSASAGVGLSLLGYELGVAGLLGHRDGGNENGLLISLLSIR